MSKIDALAMIAAASVASSYKEKIVSSNRDIRDFATTLSPEYMNGEQRKILTIPSHVMTYPQAGAHPVPKLPSFCGPPVRHANQNEGTCHKEAENNIRIPVASSIRPTYNFAAKLHSILANRNWNKVVTWLASGKAFCIIDRDEFTQKILSKYFRETKFESFSRRVKRWGFRKVSTTGTHRVIYYHDLFQRDRPHLCLLMNGRAGQKIKNDSGDTTHNKDWFEHEIVMQAALAEEFHQGSGHAMVNQRIQKNQGQVALYRSSHEVFVEPVQPQEPILKRYQHATPARPFILAGGLHLMDSVNFLDQTSVAINNSYSMSRPFFMPPNGMVVQNIKRHVSMIEERIADCEEQLELLHRLKTLKKMRQNL